MTRKISMLSASMCMIKPSYLPWSPSMIIYVCSISRLLIFPLPPFILCFHSLSPWLRLKWFHNVLELFCGNFEFCKPRKRLMRDVRCWCTASSCIERGQRVEALWEEDLNWYTATVEKDCNTARLRVGLWKTPRLTEFLRNLESC